MMSTKHYSAMTAFLIALLASSVAHSTAKGEVTAHSYLDGPLVAAPTPQTSEVIEAPQAKVSKLSIIGMNPLPKRKEGERVDHMALAKSVYSALRYDHSKKTWEEIRPLALKVIKASEDAGIDPFIAVAVVFVESRWEIKAVGDGGNACGMAQQHSRFSMKWGLSDTMQRFKDVKHPKARYWKRVRYECELLKDPDYATKVLVHHLTYLKKRAGGNLNDYIWWYNGRMAYLSKHSTWRLAMERVYEKILVLEAQRKAEKAKTNENNS